MSLLVPLTRLTDNPWQTRTGYDDEHLDELADDIEKNGLLQPPIGRMVDENGDVATVDDFYKSPRTIMQYFEDYPSHQVQLAFGHNRLRAMQILDKRGQPSAAAMDVQLRALSDERMATLAWTENEQRKDLSAMEEALAIRRRMEDFDWTQAEVAEELGIGRSTVSNKLRLLKLPDEVLEHVREGRLSERQAQALVPAMDLSEEERAVLDSHDWMRHHRWHPTSMLELALDGASSKQLRDYASTLKGQLELHADEPEPFGTNDTPWYEEEPDEDVQSVQTSDDAGEMTATEMADVLGEEHGIQVTSNRGEKNLRAILDEAEAQAAKEQPADRNELDWRFGQLTNAAEPQLTRVSQVQGALGEVKDLLRDIDRRGTWLREQRKELDTHVVRALYDKELSSLGDLVGRAQAFQEKLRDEWLPEACASEQEKMPAGDGMPEEPEVEIASKELARDLAQMDVDAWKTALREVAGIELGKSHGWDDVCKRLAAKVERGRLTAKTKAPVHEI